MDRESNEGLVPRIPLWVAVDRRAMKKHPDTGEGYVDDVEAIKAGRLPGGAYFVLFFSSRDNTERLIEWNGDKRLVALPFDDPDVIADILRKWQVKGATEVLFDMQKDGRGRRVPLDKFIKALAGE